MVPDQVSRLEESYNPRVVLVAGVVAVALNVLLYFGVFLPRMTPLIEHVSTIGTAPLEAIGNALPEAIGKSDPEARSESRSGANSESQSDASSEPQVEASSESQIEARSYFEANGESQPGTSSESQSEGSLGPTTDSSPASSPASSPDSSSGSPLSRLHLLCRHASCAVSSPSRIRPLSRSAPPP